MLVQRLGEGASWLMMKYRKKPVIVDAIQFNGSNYDEIGRFIVGAPFECLTREQEIRITTLEGLMTARLGDWIIKGVKGEFYPCKPAIFAETYEPVEA